MTGSAPSYFARYGTFAAHAIRRRRADRAPPRQRQIGDLHCQDTLGVLVPVRRGCGRDRPPLLMAVAWSALELTSRQSPFRCFPTSHGRVRCKGQDTRARTGCGGGA
jgi:hypothetical protein